MVRKDLQAATILKEQHGDSAMQAMRQALPGQYLGAGPLSSGLPPVALEAKANNSHQALLQHLLLKEQMRQQKSLTNVFVFLCAGSFDLAIKPDIVHNYSSEYARQMFDISVELKEAIV
ncbi:UNVERIFIED_CONTAM: hypothetical protein FKN15_020898 [Acipenser sinensis]